jgi:hypothetical protein
VCVCVCVFVYVAHMQGRNPLDPFLGRLCKEYTDDHDLSSRLHAYFQASRP